MIFFDNLKIGYNQERPLLNVTCSLPNQGLFAVVGKNGSGKSSLYKTLMGVIPPLDGQIIGLNRKDMLLISDYTNLPAEVTFREICSFLNIHEDDLESIFNGKLSVIYNTPIGKISSGQEKIEEIALALLMGKNILLLDEAANYLDDENVQIFHDYITDISKSTLILYTTHNLQEIIDLCAPLLIIKDKRIIQHPAVESIKDIRSLLDDIDI